MKEFKKEGFSVYETTDTLPEKFTTSTGGRLTLGQVYKILGFCAVPETTRKSDNIVIKAWDGVALENVESGKKFPIGLSTMQGIGFQKINGAFKIQTVSKQVFEDAPAIQKAFGKKVRVEKIEVLEVTPYLKENETVGKNHYVFSSPQVNNFVFPTMPQ